ncbi:hypothetical protein LOK49_LG10G02066 [Camellia lanceoleosa]|uniref:Uncharacterized protein n=1 Tax=Camellia lanceoleosa TaxID=1840588 RepID=A0ACC0G993_9ERIC|nr:hypothetical protein LOK49_LG10G02066 [Camellia lanceoleosa]
MEDSFPQWLVAGKSRRGSALREPENSPRIEDGVPAKARRLGDVLGSSADLGKGLEEVPERRAVRDGVIDGASDEDTVAELRHLCWKNSI